jgi:hypothetical protein
VPFSSKAMLRKAKRQQAPIESQLDEYRVSWDTTTSEPYTRVRGKRLFPDILRNLKGSMALMLEGRYSTLVSG